MSPYESNRSMKRFAWIGVVACLQLACSKSPQSYVERGNGLMAAGKYADAEIEYRKSILKDPKFAEGYYRLGLLEYTLRHGTEALDDLQRAVDFDRGNDRYGIDLANVSIEAYQAMPNRNNLYEQAAQEADLLLKKDPNSFDGLRLKGDVLVIDRKYDDAMSEFRKANAIKPNDPDVVLAMAQVLFAQNRDREGEQVAQEFLKVRKDFPPMYDLLEADYVRNKRAEDAERLLQLEIAALPKNAHPRLQLAGLYRASGRNQEMSQVLEKIVADRTNFPAGPILVGDFYAGFGKWDDALTQYSAGMEQSSDKDLYRRRIARALEAVGKRDAAIVELSEILRQIRKTRTSGWLAPNSCARARMRRTGIRRLRNSRRWPCNSRKTPSSTTTWDCRIWPTAIPERLGRKPRRVPPCGKTT